MFALLKHFITRHSPKQGMDIKVRVEYSQQLKILKREYEKRRNHTCFLSRTACDQTATSSCARQRDQIQQTDHKLRIASCRPTHGPMRRLIPQQQGLVWPDKMHHFIGVKQLALQKQPTEDKYWPALRPTEDSFNPFFWPSSEHLVEIYFFHFQMHNYLVVKLLKWLCLWVMRLGCANDLCPLVLITQAEYLNLWAAYKSGGRETEK